MFSGISSFIQAFGEFKEILLDFADTLLPSGLSSAIMLVVGIVLAIAAWRIVS